MVHDLHTAAQLDSTPEKIAAVREAKEEANLVLDPHALVYLSHFTTPAPSPRRFATSFFATVLDKDQPITVDNSEITDFCWITPQSALQKHRDKLLPMMGPTPFAIDAIAKHDSAKSFLEELQKQDVELAID